ncbi:MAG: hypothetical protein ABSD68_03965 [Candidatus Micrarchaeales archaeon]
MDNMMIVVGKGVKYQEVKEFQEMLRKANCNVDRFSVHYNEIKGMTGEKNEPGLFLEVGSDLFECKQVSGLLKSAFRTNKKLSEKKVEKLVVEHIKPAWVMGYPVKDLRKEKIEADKKNWD